MRGDFPTFVQSLEVNISGNSMDVNAAPLVVKSSTDN